MTETRAAPAVKSAPVATTPFPGAPAFETSEPLFAILPTADGKKPMTMRSVASLEPQKVANRSRRTSLPMLTTPLGSRAMMWVTSTVLLGSVVGALLAWTIATGWLL